MSAALTGMTCLRTEEGAGLCRHHQSRCYLYRATLSCRMCGACRLQTAINNAAEQASTSGGDRRQGAGAKHLKPIQTAVELVFGSAAALSATFGYKVCTPSSSSGLQEAIRPSGIAQPA